MSQQLGKLTLLPHALAISALIALGLVPDPARAETDQSMARSGLEVYLGQAGIFEDLSEPLLAGAEYFARPLTRWKLSPGVGLTWTESDASYVYFTLRRDFMVARNWLLTPSLAAGLFNESEELRLGHDIEFRSSLAIAYLFDNQYRIGAAIQHYSNGGISDVNPGTESATVFLAIPL